MCRMEASAWTEMDNAWVVPQFLFHAHPVWVLQVLHSSALSKELRVGQNLELNSVIAAVATEHLTKQRIFVIQESWVALFCQLLMKRSRTRVLTLAMASAVLTGTVDFSTTILEDVETEAIRRAAPSQ